MNQQYRALEGSFCQTRQLQRLYGVRCIPTLALMIYQKILKSGVRLEDLTVSRVLLKHGAKKLYIY